MRENQIKRCIYENFGKISFSPLKSGVLKSAQKMLFLPILLTTVMKNWGLVKNSDFLYWTSVWLGIEITAYFWGSSWKAKRRTLTETLYRFLFILNQVIHFWKYVVISVLSHASVPSHPVLANLDPQTLLAPLPQSQNLSLVKSFTRNEITKFLK